MRLFFGSCVIVQHVCFTFMNEHIHTLTYHVAFQLELVSRDNMCKFSFLFFFFLAGEFIYTDIWRLSSSVVCHLSYDLALLCCHANQFNVIVIVLLACCVLPSINFRIWNILAALHITDLFDAVFSCYYCYHFDCLETIWSEGVQCVVAKSFVLSF